MTGCERWSCTILHLLQHFQGEGGWVGGEAGRKLAEVAPFCTFCTIFGGKDGGGVTRGSIEGLKLKMVSGGWWSRRNAEDVKYVIIMYG